MNKFTDDRQICNKYEIEESPSWDVEANNSS